jgi:hypothetical protein
VYGLVLSPRAGAKAAHPVIAMTSTVPTIDIARDVGFWAIRSCHGREAGRSSDSEQPGDDEHERGGGLSDRRRP